MAIPGDTCNIQELGPDSAEQEGEAACRCIHGCDVSVLGETASKERRKWGWLRGHERGWGGGGGVGRRVVSMLKVFRGGSKLTTHVNIVVLRGSETKQNKTLKGKL